MLNQYHHVMVLELKGNPKITIVCRYSPHNEGPEEELDGFYSSLRSVHENVPRHNFLCVLGDLNAKIGRDDSTFTFYNNTNRNGEILLDLMDEFNLDSSNNSFMKPKNQLFSFEYPSGRDSQLDYVLFAINVINLSETLVPFISVDFDHRIVPASIKLLQNHHHTKLKLLTGKRSIKAKTFPGNLPLQCTINSRSSQRGAWKY